MAEGTYEYECARAELLGIASPNRDEFEAAARERQQQHDNEHDTLLVKTLGREKFNIYCIHKSTVCVPHRYCVLYKGRRSSGRTTQTDIRKIR